MNTRVSRFGFLPAAAALLAATAACPADDKTAAPKPCCEQVKIPAGVAAFTVVADDIVGPSDGQKVKLRVGLAAPIKRDAVYPVLHTLYRHAMKRTAFEPIDFVGEVYASEGDAKAGGDAKMLAKIWRTQSDIAPKCDNKVTYDFPEQVQNAFNASLGRAVEEDLNDPCHLSDKKVAPRFDDKFTHKPTYKLDAARQAVEVTYPYLDMGKDEYVPNLKLASALTYWIEFTTSLFHKVGNLKEVTYIGVHNELPVLTITITRPEFDARFTSLQEDIAAHASLTFQALGMHKTTDEKAAKEQDTFKIKAFKSALAELPKGHVNISPKLK